MGCAIGKGNDFFMSITNIWDLTIIPDLFFSLACFAPGRHQWITGPSMYYMAAAPAALLVGVVVDCRTARGARVGSRGSRAWRCAATASNPVLQLEVTSCFVVCLLCIAFVSLFFCAQDDNIDAVCAMIR